jgi:hypothetical protein
MAEKVNFAESRSGLFKKNMKKRGKVISEDLSKKTLTGEIKLYKPYVTGVRIQKLCFGDAFVYGKLLMDSCMNIFNLFFALFVSISWWIYCDC